MESVRISYRVCRPVPKRFFLHANRDFALAVRDLTQILPILSAAKFRCLLDLICVANATPENMGTCQYLLAGVDCLANRIIGAGDKECDIPNGA